MTWRHLLPIGCVATCPTTHALDIHLVDQNRGAAVQSAKRARLPPRPKFTHSFLRNLTSIRAFFDVVLLFTVGHFLVLTFGHAADYNAGSFA